MSLAKDYQPPQRGRINLSRDGSNLRSMRRGGPFGIQWPHCQLPDWSLHWSRCQPRPRPSRTSSIGGAADEIAEQQGSASSPAGPGEQDGALPLAPLADVSGHDKTPETGDAIEAEAEALEAAIWSHENKSSPYDRVTRVELQRLNQRRMEIRRHIKEQLEIQAEAPERIAAVNDALLKLHKELAFQREKQALEIERSKIARQRELAALAELRKINAEIWRTAFPEKAAARDRAKERAAARVAAAAAERDAEQAYLDELVEVECTYTRLLGRHNETIGWATLPIWNRTAKVKRRDAAAVEADQQEGLAWLAKQRRDEMADAFAQHHRHEKQTDFRSDRERQEYFAQWGIDSDRGRAYRERQRERGLPTAVPERIKRRIG